VIPLAVVMGVVIERAGYSVIVATVMHGAANIATPILLPGVDRQVVQLVTGSVYVALAAVLAIQARGMLGASRPTITRLAVRPHTEAAG
jgi:hypothetical protein